MTQEEFFRDTILRWEGGLSIDPADRGNWARDAAGQRVLVGSCHGVTPAVLARFRGCQAVSAAEMAVLSLAEAVRVALRLFYREPGLVRLPWDAVMAAVADFGWGAGPGVAVRRLQQLLGVATDGCIGPRTVAAYRARLAADGVAMLAAAWERNRAAFYRSLAAQRPGDARFLAGWLRRSASFLPGTPWWQRFSAAETG